MDQILSDLGEDISTPLSSPSDMESERQHRRQRDREARKKREATEDQEADEFDRFLASQPPNLRTHEGRVKYLDELSKRAGYPSFDDMQGKVFEGRYAPKGAKNAPSSNE